MTPEATRAHFKSTGYAPTNVAAIEEKDEFYQQIQTAIDKTPKRDMKFLMGDTNTKVGADNTNSEHLWVNTALECIIRMENF